MLIAELEMARHEQGRVVVQDLCQADQDEEKPRRHAKCKQAEAPRPKRRTDRRTARSPGATCKTGGDLRHPGIAGQRTIGDTSLFNHSCRCVERSTYGWNG